jgi:anti-sigma factor RsiW
MTLKTNYETSGACPEFEARLEDRVSGEISAADAGALGAHLETCGACRTALEHAAFSSRLMRVAEPTPDPGPGFAHMTMAHIRQAQRDGVEERSIWSPFVSLAWKFAATSGVAIALLLTFDISKHRGVSPEGTYLSSMDDSGLFSDVNYSAADRDDFLISAPGEGSHGRH